MKKSKYLGLFLFPFVLPLPLPMKYSAMALIIFIINLVLLVKKENLSNLKLVIKTPLVIILLLFFLSDYISAIVRFDFNPKVFREVKLAFILLPALILLQKEIIVKEFVNIIKAFFYGVLFYIVFAWANVWYFYTITHPTYIFDPTDHFIVYVLARETPNSIHHTYIGLYILLITIIVFAYTVLYKKISLFLGLFLTLFFLVNSFYIGGKSTTMLLVVFLTFILLKPVAKGFQIKGLKYYILGLILAVVVGVNGIYEWLTVSIKQSLGLRINIYKRCIDVTMETFPFGIGKEKLNYIPLNIHSNDGEHLITHNIYFNELIINGFIGLLILLSMLFYVCYIGYKSHITFWLFALSIVAIGLSEDLFVRQAGVLFFVFFTCIFYVKFYKIPNPNLFCCNSLEKITLI
ncbi:hypothetical protein [Algibacter sp. 2305UL17-15]|uniref:O-antigen ligase family protein n=1 Tax=Algibacter sp. 2305UL17-15 TaxID=3231268 RepID=UPI003457FD0C